jgi:hypothetical protein
MAPVRSKRYESVYGVGLSSERQTVVGYDEWSTYLYLALAVVCALLMLAILWRYSKGGDDDDS